MTWEMEPLADGTRWRLLDDGPIRNVLVTVVRLPGTMYRAYFFGGEMCDASTAYLIHCEVRKRLHNDDIPRMPGFSDNVWFAPIRPTA